MILADKIIALRKKNGWSQEELADKVGVSRQAVSKWEGAQSIPDLDKLLTLSKLFGVSTDYLLKEDAPEFVQSTEEPLDTIRAVTLEDANEYLTLREAAAPRIALGVMLAIASAMIVVLAAAITEKINSEFIMMGGVAVCLVLVASAVFLFVSTGQMSQEYEFMDKEPFETKYGVEGMVRARKEQFKSTYIKLIAFAIPLLVVSPIPILVGSAADNGSHILYMVAVTLGIIAIGVALIVFAGVRWESFNKLLQEGDYTHENKKASVALAPFISAYWLILVAVYLGVSLTQGAWGHSWIIMVIGSILFVVFYVFARMIYDANAKKK